MSTQFQPPPTYADPVVVDEATRKGQFNPIWLKWFLDLSQFINNNGGGNTIQHNSLSGLQGGTANQYYHLTLASYTILNNVGTPTAGSVAYGTGSSIAFSPVGTAGQVLTSTGAGSPTWTTLNKTTGTSILYGNGSGGFSNVTIGSGVSFTGGTLSATGTGGTITSVTATTPLASSGGTTPNLTIQQSSASQAGYLSAADWSTFNGKQPAGTYVNSVTGTSPVVSSGGVNPAISMPAATTSVNGYLTSTDWNTFNNKQPAGAYLTAVTSDAPLTGAGTSASHLSMPAATTSVSGYLTSTDWNTFNNKGSGTVTSVTGTAPIVSSGGTTPAISLAAAYGDTLNPYAAKTANYVLAGPTTGAAAVPTFRALVAADIPSLSYVTSVSGTSGRITSTGGTTPVIDLASGVATAGTTGSSLLIPVVTIDTYGRVTSITTAANPQGTVTSVAALTLGTTGTDLSSSVANGTTTPVITLNVPTASATNRGALSAADWTTFNNKQPAGTYVTSVTGTAPVVSSGGTTPAISMAAATTSVSGYLTSTDWNTFNNKQPAGAYLTAVTSDAPLTGAGTSASHLSMPAATTSVSGYLTSTDWNTFNNKGSGTVTSVTGTAPVVSSGGTTPAISMAAATTSVSGYLTSTDWNTFNGKQAAGTYVTAVSVVSANGFAGTVTTGATPAITLTTSITGLLKGNGTAISAAVANTDYVPLSTVLTKTADYTITNTDMWIINNKTGSALTLTFPAASSWTGRQITVKNMQAQLVNSASANIVPIDSTTAGTAILLNVIGNWATLVSDGTNWVIMQAASNNNLLLE